MPLRPDFHHWVNIITEYKYHEDLRRKFAIRSNDGFNPKSKEQWDAMVGRLPERIEDSPKELEAIQGSLSILSRKLESLHKIGNIVYMKGEKPFFILENITMYSQYNTVCCVIDLEKLIKHGCVSSKQIEIEKIEAARWKIIKAAGVYVILCAAATWLGDLREAIP